MCCRLWAGTVLVILCMRISTVVGGDDLLELSGDYDRWSPQEVLSANQAQDSDDSWVGTPDDVASQADTLNEDELGDSAFRDALTSEQQSTESDENRAAFENALKEGSGGGDPEDSMFRDALREEGHAQSQRTDETVARLKQRLQKARQLGEDLGVEIKNVTAAAGGYGPPVLKGEYSKRDRKKYYDGWHEHAFGEETTYTKHQEPWPYTGNRPGNASFDYFRKLHAAQREQKRNEAMAPDADDVLPYPYAGLFCTHQLDNQILKPGECTRASPLKCNLAYQLCQFRVVKGNRASWVDVEPQADCFRTKECEKIRELRHQDIVFKRRKKELKKDKERAFKMAQEKMETRDEIRRKRDDDTEDLVKKDWRKVETHLEDVVHVATLHGNAPLPTDRFLKNQRALIEKLTSTKKKILKLEDRFAQLGNLIPGCTQLYKRCQTGCPPLDLLKLQRENACTIRCKELKGQCIMKGVEKRYEGVAATARDIKAAIFARRAKEQLAREEEAQKEAAAKKKEANVGEANVFKMSSGHGVIN